MPPSMSFSYGGPRPLSPPQTSKDYGGRNKIFLPGDVKTLNTKGFGEGMPIWKRLAVIVRAYPGLEVFEVMKGLDPHDRKFFERTQFYRAIENLVGKAWLELAITTEEFDELCEPYLTKKSGPGGPPPMIQYKRFALDLQRYADQVLTDDDITKAQELRGYVNPGDLVRNDGFFEARKDEIGKDMSPDKRRLKKHQSPQALASGLWEYEELAEEDWDTGDDRKPGEATAASRLGWGAGAKKAVAADYADMSEFEKERQIRDIFAGNLYEDPSGAKYGH
eukprot:jgi/Chrpa1/11719/Chrysochromulina_OHIO_Genome00019773-RA